MGTFVVDSKSALCSAQCFQELWKYSSTRVMTDFCKNATRVPDNFLNWSFNDHNVLKAFSLFDFDIDRKNYNLCLADIAFRQLVFNAHRALSFHLNFISQGFGCFVQLLGGHVGMGDASWTCCDGNDLHTDSAMLFCSSWSGP